MKKGFLIAVSVFCAIVIFSGMLVSSASDNSGAVPEEKNEVSAEQVFVDMLNHNFVYGEDFDNADTVINRSVNALSMYKTDSGNFISQHYVADFVRNMYGISVVDFSGLNCEYPQKDGYVYIVPFEYRSFYHSAPEVICNEDGTLTVKTDVAVTDCNGKVYDYEATSLFVYNEESEFGFNIISSDISESTFSA